MAGLRSLIESIADTRGARSISCTADVAADWKAYLDAYWSGATKEEIATFFECSPSTVGNRRAMYCEPRGRHVLRALRQHPEAAPLLLGIRD